MSLSKFSVLKEVAEKATVPFASTCYFHHEGFRLNMINLIYEDEDGVECEETINGVVVVLVVRGTQVLTYLVGKKHCYNLVRREEGYYRAFSNNTMYGFKSLCTKNTHSKNQTDEFCRCQQLHPMQFFKNAYGEVIGINKPGMRKAVANVSKYLETFSAYPIGDIEITYDIVKLCVSDMIEDLTHKTLPHPKQINNILQTEWNEILENSDLWFYKKNDFRSYLVECATKFKRLPVGIPCEPEQTTEPAPEQTTEPAPEQTTEPAPRSRPTSPAPAPEALKTFEWADVEMEPPVLNTSDSAILWMLNGLLYNQHRQIVAYRKDTGDARKAMVWVAGSIAMIMAERNPQGLQFTPSEINQISPDEIPDLITSLTELSSTPNIPPEMEDAIDAKIPKLQKLLK